MKKLRLLLPLVAIATVLFSVMPAAAATPSAAGSSAVSGTSSAATSAVSSASAPDDSWQKVQQSGKLVIGLDASFPPMGFKDANGNIVGLDIDLANEVCRRLGLQLVCQPIDWDAKDQELDTGHIDCIWNGFTITADREQNYLFTDPYLSNEQVFVVQKDSPLQSIDDLDGKRIAIQRGSSAEDAMNNDAALKQEVTINLFSDNVTALEDVRVGQSDALLEDSVVAEYDIKNTDKDFRVLPGSLANEEYGVGFRLTDHTLRDKVNDTLAQMKADGTLQQIESKWLAGAEVTQKPGFWQNLSNMLPQLGNGFGVTLAIFFLTLIFSIPLAALVTWERISRVGKHSARKCVQFFGWLIRAIFRVYISIMRGTPLMLQILLVYFAPPLLFGNQFSYNRFIAVIIAFVLNYAAYFAEIYRGGIEAMPAGQYEAASVLGFGRVTTFFRIILPQVFKRILPATANEVITLVKDTSLASIISVVELLLISKQMEAAQSSLLPLLAAGVFYYIFNALVAFVFERTEKHLNYYR